MPRDFDNVRRFREYVNNLLDLLDQSRRIG
jgi:hypothetical protein